MNSTQQAPVKSFFHYNAKIYSGYVYGSTDVMPHQYWFFFCEPELVEIISDCIMFNETAGKLQPARIYHGHENIVHIIGGMIRSKLSRGDFIAEV